MQNLHDKVSRELVDALERFLDGEIELERLLEAQERENLVCEFESWERVRSELKESVFQLTRKLFTEANECEKEIRTFQRLDETAFVDCDVKGLTAHALLLGRNKAPPFGFEHSNWYLGPYPTIHMVEMLRTDPSEEVARDKP